MRFIIFFLLNVVCGYMINVNPINSKNIKFCCNCAELFVQNKEYKCRLFYNLDVISGRKYFYTCDMARANNSLCGEDAKYFYYSNSEPSSND